MWSDLSIYGRGYPGDPGPGSLPSNSLRFYDEFFSEVRYCFCCSLALFSSLFFLYLLKLRNEKPSLKSLVKVESVVVVFIFLIYFLDHQIFIWVLFLRAIVTSIFLVMVSSD